MSHINNKTSFRVLYIFSKNDFVLEIVSSVEIWLTVQRGRIGTGSDTEIARNALNMSQCGNTASDKDAVQSFFRTLLLPSTKAAFSMCQMDSGKDSIAYKTAYYP